MQTYLWFPAFFISAIIILLEMSNPNANRYTGVPEGYEYADPAAYGRIEKLRAENPERRPFVPNTPLAKTLVKKLQEQNNALGVVKPKMKQGKELAPEWLRKGYVPPRSAKEIADEAWKKKRPSRDPDEDFFLPGEVMEAKVEYPMITPETDFPGSHYNSLQEWLDAEVDVIMAPGREPVKMSRAAFNAVKQKMG